MNLTVVRARARVAALLVGALASSAAADATTPAHGGRVKPPDELMLARVLVARGDALWLTDARGKGPAVAVVGLPAPATGVRTIRTDAAGTRVLVELDGRWWWAPVSTDGSRNEVQELPCGAGPARFTRSGDLVLCAAATGEALIVRLRDGKLFPRAAPAAGAAFFEHDGVRELAWTDGTAVLAAPLARAGDVRTLAPSAPLRGLLASPDGTRAVGVYKDRSLKTRGRTADDEHDQLFGFALDGTGARRRLIRDGVVLDWSWDSRWLLVQDGAKACIARATGGQFKCWKGFTAVSLSPDGAWALVLGPRAGADAAAVEEKPTGGSGESASGEGGEGEHDEDDADPGLPPGPLSLYRAKLAGPYTEKPALVETMIDGAAVWLPPVTVP